MDGLKQPVLGKSRSYTACLSEAHKMFFDNVRLIFKTTWAYVAVAALTVAAFAYLLNDVASGDASPATIGGLSVAAVAVLCSQVAYYAKVMSLLNGRRLRWNVVRCAALAACLLALVVVVAAIGVGAALIMMAAEPGSPIVDLRPLFVACAIALPVITLLLLPYAYAAMKYLIDDGAVLRRVLANSYVTGFRHWGFVFAALFIAVLCASLIAILVSLPAVIVMAAGSLSVYGVTFLGDPAGLPSYFAVLQFAAFTLFTFICMYVNVFVVFTTYYIYGSIEANEQNRKGADAIA